MKAVSKIHRLRIGIATVGLLAFVGVNMASAKPVSSGGKAVSGYNAIPSKLPGSVASQGFECCQTDEFGDQVILGGTGRTLQSMSVVMVSFACEAGRWDTNNCVSSPGATFPVPLTFTIYDDEDGDGVPGDVLAQQTQIVNIRYRPSASPECGDGRWFDTRDKLCYNGFAQTIEMSFATPITLPDGVIWSVAFNTTTSGHDPIGPQACNLTPQGCPYDSLNVGAFSAPNAPYVGIDVDEDEAFRNGVMEPDWTGFRPLGAIKTRK